MNAWERVACTIFIVLASSRCVCVLGNGASQNACCSKGQCCLEESPCCVYAKSCCDKNTKGCCDGYGCVNPCESQFDAIGCQLPEVCLDVNDNYKLTERKRRVISNKLYRILRVDEDPVKGITAKNPSATRTVLSHVNCGSRPNYASQYISTTTSLDVARRYIKMAEAKGMTGLRIAEIDLDALPENCRLVSVDLTSEANRDKHLGNAVCKNFAKASSEVLLICDQPIPCKVIDPPESPMRKLMSIQKCSGGTFPHMHHMQFIIFPFLHFCLL